MYRSISGKLQINMQKCGNWMNRMMHKPDREPIYGGRGSMPFFKNDWNYFPKKNGRMKKLSFFHTPFFMSSEDL